MAVQSRVAFTKHRLDRTREQPVRFEALENRALLTAVSFLNHEVILPPEIERPDAVQAIDMDGDGDQDVFTVSDRESNIRWFENLDGSGTFSEVREVASSWNGIAYATPADFDADGDVDVLAAIWVYPIGLDVGVYENNGNGFDYKPDALPTELAWIPSYNAVVTDVDGDGDEDIVGYGDGNNESYKDRSLFWLENSDGQGTFTNHFAIEVFQDVPNLNLSIADVDDDGDEDLLTSHAGEIGWFENTDGLRAFGPKQIVSADVVDLATVHPSDFDGDGDSDLLATNSQDELVWFENTDGRGAFEFATATTVDRFQSLSLADIDQDDDQDLLIARTPDRGEMHWLENQGGAFGDEHLIQAEPAAEMRGAVAADIDGDGKTDLLSAFENELAWYKNVGDANFTGKRFVSRPAPVQRISSLKLADLDRDGDDDLVVAGDGVLAYYESSESPGLGPKKIIDADLGSIHTVDARDLDRDGHLDLLTFSESEPGIAWYRNTGSGSFGTKSVVTTANDFESVETVDFDSDGDLDFVYFKTVHRQNEPIGWIENADGSFRPPQTLVMTDVELSSISVSDVDGDGDNDVLATSRDETHLVWFEQSDKGQLDSAAHTLWAWDDEISLVQRVVTEDIDENGHDDILVEYEIAANFIRRGVFVIRDAADFQSFIENGLELPERLQDRYFPPEKVRGEFTGIRSTFHLANIDGEHGLDMIWAAPSGWGDELAWMRNTGQPPGIFGDSSYADKDPLRALRDVALIDAGDIDGDGDTDIVSAAKSGAISLYENRQNVFGDANRNGEVDFNDFLVLAENFAKRVDAVWEDGDFNSDGHVNFEDFLLLASQFSRTSS